MLQTYRPDTDIKQVTRTIFDFSEYSYNSLIFPNKKRVIPICLYDTYYFCETLDHGVIVFLIPEGRFLNTCIKSGNAQDFRHNPKTYIAHLLVGELGSKNMSEENYYQKVEELEGHLITDKKFREWERDYNAGAGIGGLPGIVSDICKTILADKFLIERNIIPYLSKNWDYKTNIKYKRPFFDAGFFCDWSGNREPYSLGCIVEDAIVHYFRERGYPV